MLSKLRAITSRRFVLDLLGSAPSTLDLGEILDGGILIARLPKGILGEDTTRLVGSLLLTGLWQAATARTRRPEPERLDAAVVVDECHNFLHLPIGLDDAPLPPPRPRPVRTTFCQNAIRAAPTGTDPQVIPQTAVDPTVPD